MIIIKKEGGGDRTVNKEQYRGMKTGIFKDNLKAEGLEKISKDDVIIKNNIVNFAPYQSQLDGKAYIAEVLVSNLADLRATNYR